MPFIFAQSILKLLLLLLLMLLLLAKRKCGNTKQRIGLKIYFKDFSVLPSNALRNGTDKRSLYRCCCCSMNFKRYVETKKAFLYDDVQRVPIIKN